MPRPQRNPAQPANEPLQPPVTAPDRIHSRESAEQALAELNWIDSVLGTHRQVEAADVRQASESAQATAREQLDQALGQTDALGKLTERRTLLADKLDHWCVTHLTRDLREGEKSLQTDAGTLGVRSTPPAVTCAEDEKVILDRVRERIGWAKRVADWLQTTVGALTVGMLVRVKLELDKPAIKTAWHAGQRNQDGLKALGLSVASQTVAVIETRYAADHK